MGQSIFSQQKFAHDLLVRLNLEGVKPLSTPVVQGSKLSNHSGRTLSDPALYWTAVGALHYLTITWPDIQYTVNQACQFQHHPTDVHCAAVKRILRYVTYTFSNGIVLRPEKPFTLTAYSDAD